MVWQVRSLQSVLRLSYAAMATRDKPGLRVCKNCGKVYYNSHAKSEFCSARCRNYYNVKVFRKRNSNDVLQTDTDPYNKLSEEETHWLMRTAQKSKLAKSHVSQRGKKRR